MAAVVGVILNLSIWFALHVLFAELGRLSTGPLMLPVPRWESLDPAALDAGMFGHQREAQPHSDVGTPGPSLVAAIEPVEDLFAHVGRNARSGVLDPDAHRGLGQRVVAVGVVQ